MGAVDLTEVAQRFTEETYGPLPSDEEGEERWHARLGLVFRAMAFYQREAEAGSTAPQKGPHEEA